MAASSRDGPPRQKRASSANRFLCTWRSDGTEQGEWDRLPLPFRIQVVNLAN